ncbi:MAG: SDR family NAD(P)-dependent oxidoreductase, partial [Candidatus Thorarchaeota archaeon]
MNGDVFVDIGLAGKHILITGASGGIGLVCAGMFLAEGAKVTGTYNRSEKPLEELKSKWSDSFSAVKVDQNSENDVQSLFDKANQIFGRVDILVANAGIAPQEGKSIQEMTLEQWENTLRVNLTGSFLCAKYFFANLE